MTPPSGVKGKVVRRLFGSRLSALLTSLMVLASLTGVAMAVQVGGGSSLGFEIDGNFVDNPGGGPIDWANITPVIVHDDTADSGFTEGSKELKPSDWVCGTGGASPNKGNFLRAYAHPRVSQDGVFVDLAWVGENISGQGDVYLNFEFNQNGSHEEPEDFTPGECSIPRVADDLLVTYDFPGGDDLPTLNLYRWVPSAPDVNSDGNWVNLNLTDALADAAVNATQLQDPFDGTIVAQRFGEATVDLFHAFPKMFEDTCDIDGFVNVRSRSSHSLTSALQDKLPSTALDLSTCGKITIHKVDDHVPPQPLAGALFGIWDNANTSGQPLQTKSTGADGSATFDGLTPGDYWVKEISAPAGYSPDPDTVGPITVGIREHVDVAEPFVDPRDKGTLRIVKELEDENGQPVVPDDASDLDGATFIVFKDANGNGTYQAGEEAKLWPAETQTATCTVTGGAGQCDVGPLATGTYGVHESAAPAGTTAGDDIFPVVVLKNAIVTVNYVNSLSPLNITLDKSGEQMAHVGDTIHYTFKATTTGPKLHDIVVEELGTDRCDGAITGPTKTGGDADAFLEVGETWTYGCDHVVTANDPDPLPNEAKVTGTDDFGRDVQDTDTHNVLILKPEITLDKKVEGGDHKPVGDAFQTYAGTQLDYTVVITNTGDADLEITALSDTLRANLPASCSAGIGSTLAVAGTITCSYSMTAAADAHNVASVTGVDDLGGAKGTVSADDETFVDVIAPAIEVVKDGPAMAHAGDTATFTFKVTNTGDVELTDIEVVDDEFGAIGTIASLSVGDSETISKDFVVPGLATSPTCDEGHYNVATVTASDPLDNDVTDTDDHCTEIADPDIEVVKSGPGQAHAGDTATFTFEVKNTGNVDLTDVEVVDSEFGAIGTIASLTVGDTETITKDFVVPGLATAPNCLEGHYNVATATGTDPLGKTVSDTDDHCVDLADPDIEVVKDGPGMAHAGDTATFTFKVTNIGDVDLTNVSVVDSEFGPVGTIAGTLAVGQSQTLTKDFVVPGIEPGINCDNGHYNIATASGTDSLGKTVTDTDDHCTTIIDPSIEVEKNGPGQVHAGDTVTYTFKVTNTGDVELTDIEVVDDEFGAIGTVASLDPNESTTISKDFVVPGVNAGPDCDDGHYNVAEATAKDPLDGEVSDEDDHCAQLIDPAIEVVKTGAALAHEGDVVTYDFEVTNTGDVDLTDVTVTDDVLGDIGVVGDLAVGDSETLSKDFTVPENTDQVDNIATACGDDPTDLEVCDTDPHSLLVIHPDIQIVKTADPDSVNPGQTVTFTYVVTNIGDTELTSIEVVDDVLGDIGTIDSLQPGESATLTAEQVTQDDTPRTNIGTACGVDALDLEVCDDSTETITIVLPSGPEPRPLPTTGARILAFLALATTLIGAGLAMRQTLRQWRQQEA